MQARTGTVTGYHKITLCLLESQDMGNKLCIVPGENFTAQSLLLYGYGAIKELNESSHFSLVVVFFWSQTFLICFS